MYKRFDSLDGEDYIPTKFDDNYLRRNRYSVASRRISGIYFLMEFGRIVYVGQAVDLGYRLAIQLRRFSCVTHFSILRCEEPDLDLWESYYILKFQPELNLKPGALSENQVLQKLRERKEQSESETLRIQKNLIEIVQEVDETLRNLI
jgi:hypothetical protein